MFSPRLKNHRCAIRIEQLVVNLLELEISSLAMHLTTQRLARQGSPLVCLLFVLDRCLNT